MDHRTPCSLIFIPDWDADVVPVSMCCCSGIPHEVCNEGTPEEVAPQIFLNSSNKNIARKKETYKEMLAGGDKATAIWVHMGSYEECSGPLWGLA